ncbi:Integral membrane protein [Penicillium chermesinum]|uniref:Integral membrane protein n=1 Tax=Penicillium chermesinum TaxID=63820 RepID=A0A9W9PAC2_9EURO|nr:Integral membrane protein [Penicillium chermesinum]KAJ5239352.1 Integral membrane protein [Penicillium chermesinum]KAJ6164974.1 Integral membrane protein [Penicillium chermesinum]
MRAHWALLLSLISILVTPALSSTASSTFPQCALSCPGLQQASTSCAAGGSSSWLSCFCKSPLLSSSKVSDCSSCPDPSDRNLITTWYKQYCTDRSPEGGNLVTKRADGQDQSWWSTHYQWVIMVIVLAVGFSLIAVGGVYLKRRYDAKHIPYMVAAPGPGFSNSAGVLAPAPVADAASAPGPRPPKSAGPVSLASSSRTDIPRGSTPLGSSRRLTKGAQTAAGDVEIRQMSRSRS